VKPRNAELSLLILALIVAFGTFALVDLARAPDLQPAFWRFLAEFGALAVGGHLAIRWLAPSSDPILYPVAVGLSGFGYGMIHRLDPKLADAQLGWIAIGMAAFVLTLFIVRDHRSLENYSYIFMVLGIALLLLPMTGIGTDLNRSARLWVRIGALTFQPSELAKIVLAIFLAGYLARKREVMTITSFRMGPIGIPAPRHFGPLLLAWGLSLAVMFYEKDLGSSLLFFALFVVTLYAATARAIYAASGLALFAGGATIAAQKFSHVAARVNDWLDPWKTIQGSGRQIAQSAFALAAGGFTGAGLGRGHPELIDPGLRSGTLPTDFIFAAIGEELGLLGSAALLILFGLVAARGFHIALRSRDTFGTLLATGLSVLIGLQAFLIMAGVSRLLPLTGITLPFISYGGSSLLANFVLVALLMRISDSEAVS
jgi:cell division protein FtsW (lipid II flippase)